ncbi:MAG: 3-hydroxyacyl-ACP dehydratase [Bacteroidetes bacterium]|nr:3-hydroxyacyl-ACP dehydratase [Bacteroidota bacterium]MBL6943268.1 3-hydroxyacyl-ACP dehydratase [Bacteroidales bacterium]
MLIKGFYKTIEVASNGLDITATIKLNVDHEVYNGHFPGKPVVPGVIQLQIVKELVEKNIDKKLFMKKIGQVKYLVPIIPGNSPQLVFTISNKKTDENKIKSIVSIGYDNIVFTKAKIEFIEKKVIK